MPALIFDCDGVLADTERYGHLPAFNRMFEEFEIPVRWSEDDYAGLLTIGGGKERMATLLTPQFLAANRLPTDPEGQAELIARWHRRKTDIYTALIDDGALPPRAGVRRLSRDAVENGWALAVASTSAERSVRSVLVHAVGEELAAHFKVFAGDVVAHKKPAPDIYRLAISQMRVSDGDGIAVEDSHNGLAAALAAGLACLVTTSSYTRDEDFNGAGLVVTTLGDPNGSDGSTVDVPFEVLSDPLAVHPEAFVSLEHVGVVQAAARAGEIAYQQHGGGLR
jgi:HAD superfamily hydrolase (TIGR01509 family)